MPSVALAIWMEAQADASIHVPAMTVAEVERGILLLPAGRKRQGLEAWFSAEDGVLALFVDRILPFDRGAASTWARLMVEGRRAGHPRDPLDMIVVAIAEAHGCIVVTENEQDFLGLPVINPVRTRS